MELPNRPSPQTGWMPLIVIGVVSIVFSVLLALALPSLGVLPPQGSVQAQNTDALFTVLVLLGGVVFWLVQILLYYAAVRFRAPAADTSDGPNLHGNAMMEITWTVIPSVVVFILAILSFITWQNNTAVSENPNLINGESVAVTTIGQRFAWSFDYATNETDPDGEPVVLTETDLYVYAGQDVELQMETRDVIHSFWIPAMRVKQDLLPGRVTEIRFTPVDTGAWQYVRVMNPITVYSLNSTNSDVIFEEPAPAEGEFPTLIEFELVNPDADLGDWVQVRLNNGLEGYIPGEAVLGRYNTYQLLCTELCGSGHGDMVTDVFVFESEEAMLNAWYDPAVQVATTPVDNPIAYGQQVIDNYGCGGCHMLEGYEWNGITGPNQSGLGSRVAERAASLADVENGAEYIAESIRQPADYLTPGYGNLMRVYDPETMPQEDLVGIVAFLCTQTASGDPADSTCGLENWQFDEDGNFTGDTRALVDELTTITEEYE